MEEKTYLKWYSKIGYGSGDVAGNVVYAFLTSFVMIYLTDTIGLMPGIVGTLIAASKLFDGVTDIFFGSMIDKTHSRLGKARPWMLYGYIGCAITLVAVFAVPTSFGDTAKYAWFFIAYTLLNGVFYTANNIAYSALTSLVTKNAKERVQMGSYRFIFAFATSLVIQSVTVGFVDKCGGGAAAWRTVAIIYAIIGFVVNTISCLSVKELPEEELNDGAVTDKEEKYGLVQAYAGSSRQGTGNRCRLPWKRTVDVTVYGGRCTGTGTMAGRHECAHRILLGIYLSDTGKTCGWNDVFLYFPWHQDRWRNRNRTGRMAFGDQRICRYGSNTAGIQLTDALIYVPVAPTGI